MNCLHGIAKPVVLLLACSSLARGQTAANASSREQLENRIRAARTAFDRGTALFQNAPDDALVSFREARDHFQFVVDAGIRNAKLYYNLGNAHLRLGELGPAIADYRRAQRLPAGGWGFTSDGQLEANLRFARSLRRDRIESGGTATLLRTLFAWHYNIPLRTRMTVALFCYGVFSMLMIARVLTSRFRLRYASGLTLVIWVALGTSVVLDWPRNDTPTEGVLIADDVIVRKGDGEGYDRQFKQPLHEGVEFVVLEIRGGWIHIKLPDENRGWIQRRNAVLF